MIEFKNVKMVFGDCVALSDCSLQIRRGEIHGIVGENGAGKSTAMKILFGMYQATSGQIYIDNNEVLFDSPIAAMNFGIGMVHQHFMLAEPLTALDNILLHTTGHPLKTLPRKEALTQLSNLAQQYGFQIDLTKKVEQLSVGEQQRVEILKVLSQNSDIIILDEPTAVLTPQEVQLLFQNIENLKAAGKTILIITHKLKEIKKITNRITVFRAGKTVATYQTSDVNEEQIAEAMVGRKIHQAPERVSRIDSNVIRMSVQTSAGSFEVYGKEIIGIAGIEGNGQAELIDWLFKNRLHRGKQRQAILQFGAFPEDRLRFGVLPDRPVYENFLLGKHHEKHFQSKGLISAFLSRLFGGVLNFNKIQQKTTEAMEKFDVRPRNIHTKLASLSGGNQQKLVVARELLDKPEFVLAAQPTRGVDIGAIEFIHNQLRLTRDEGAGVILVSSELEELLQLSDRILVLYKNKFVAEFKRSEFDEIKIGKAMGGGVS